MRRRSRGRVTTTRSHYGSGTVCSPSATHHLGSEDLALSRSHVGLPNHRRQSNLRRVRELSRHFSLTRNTLWYPSSGCLLKWSSIASRFPPRRRCRSPTYGT